MTNYGAWIAPLLSRPLLSGTLLSVIVLTGCASSTPGTGQGQSPASSSAHEEAFRRAFENPGGMWMPEQMTMPAHVEAFKKMGVAIDPAALADPLRAPLGAVVWLGGCTASFVSPSGLVVTNHHCVQGALRYNATPDKNLIEDGFLATTMDDEPSAGPAERIYVAEAFTDVTSTMREGLESMDNGKARKDAWDARQKRLVADCEKDRPWVRCSVVSYFGGQAVRLIEMLEIKDVRLVYAPKRSVGNYGGEIDNWAWPRHTGDYSFLRAYVGPDGKPAEYAKENRPYTPKHWLKVSDGGVKEGDFVMVAGYPGRTSRTQTFRETEHGVSWLYPYLVDYFQARYDVAQSFVNTEGQTKIKATVEKQRAQNGLEKYQGILNGLKDNAELLPRKRHVDDEIRAWAARPENPQRKEELEKLDALVEGEIASQKHDLDQSLVFRTSALLSTALELTRWADERALPDPDRRPGYQARDLPLARDMQEGMLKAYDRSLDRAMLEMALKRAIRDESPAPTWVAELLGVGQKNAKRVNDRLIEQTLKKWYQRPTIESTKMRVDLLTRGTTQTVRKTRDPFMQAAQRVFKYYKEAEFVRDQRTGDRLLYAPAYIEGMRQVMSGTLAPDANSTLRITYGTVKGLPGVPSAGRASGASGISSALAVPTRPFTVASEIPEKNTGEEPFNAPEPLLNAIAAKNYGKYADSYLGADGELPVNFLSDLDITGGNSGSPTLNARGELIGLAFDGTTDGLASDVVFDGRRTRVIHADARYMLWNMDLLDGADRLIEEMGLQPAL
ncbi:MAG: S46 family peptidase [Deltaproteobacteria bacterium]|nr:S46 family peptidase [Deltaproteobacteria bacterium]